ncbi:Animal haem peroxidase [Tistlia consotensis]|uniref:Animal haem peroxidase n=1 Tax=Tistlia consotensis USBA 355 TaxID=560819 RepID=A0A1Y6B8W9_9PROT|nr:peroxidase family protein [Tistlia consotensis]SME97674.1 Animal haem peroxidase [Tistlia consotensis USBA 355]SNR57036.1 Animal haem peroxidase [Tistlia consotensis]
MHCPFSGPQLTEPKARAQDRGDALAHRLGHHLGRSNAFGPAADDELFDGYPTDRKVVRLGEEPDTADEAPEAAAPDESVGTLDRLFRRMTLGSRQDYEDQHCGYKAEDNPNLPAGYTYFAQLVAHDLVAHVAPIAHSDQQEVRAARNFRTQRLFLETIYGAGPLVTPAPFAAPPDSWSYVRKRLRLGRVGKAETGPDKAKWGERPLEPGFPARDIPRASCPFVEEVARPGLTDTLLADSRNDDSLILSQMTALFHEFHNIVLDATAGPLTTRSSNLEHYEHFIRTRKIVAYVFRRIVVQDLLKRLLDTGVYSGLETALSDLSRGRHHHPLFSVSPDEQRIPVEFSHAVYRFAHRLVRPNYVVNGIQRRPGTIYQLLERSSARSPSLLPLGTDWLVDWKHFFEIDPAVKPNLGRRINPQFGGGAMAGDTTLVVGDTRTGHGVMHRDLMRSVGCGMRTVDSLIARLPPSDKARSDLLGFPKIRKRAIKEWLLATPFHGFERGEAEAIAENPPLYFFTLFEAAMDKCGERLGILGSTIVAGVMLSALRVMQPVVEGDPEVAAAADSVFAGAVPGTLPELIAFIAGDRARRGEPPF